MFNKILLGVVCLFWTCTAFTQSQYYYTDTGILSLTSTTHNFIITANESSTLQRVRVDDVKKYQSWPHTTYSVLETTKAMTPSEVAASLGFDTDEVQISTGFALEDGFVLYPTREIVVKLGDKNDAPAMRQILARFGVKDIVKKYGTYRVEMNQLDQVFKAANALAESGLTEFAQPDFYAPIQRYQINDPLFSQQFQMNNTGQTLDGVTGQNDADCNALEAWGISIGSSGITVAVIDDGLESHEDLNDSGGQSRYTAGFSPADNGNGNAVSGSAHGVSCAGSIAASHNSIGVRGVAPLVNLISVNIFIGGESTQDIADGFTWAKNQGADVMSNSWGYTSCTASFANINNAMSDANSNGRGGLGSVVVFASGNGYKSCVDYPANQSSVIAVGAFANTGVRSAYSNYGPALDIVAPSNNVGGPGAGVRTTDRMGGNGYNSTNYTSTFGGTSSACPVVSGVAALVLGYNATLTSAEVKNILYTTAGTIGSVNEYGAGKVNALGALQAAGGGGGPTCTDGVQNGQETGVDCGGPTCPTCPPPTGCTDTEVTLSITLDNYPEETTWTLTNDGGQTVASGGTYGSQPDGSTVTEVLCLADDCYTFTINDAYGDGICCSYGNGSYSLTQGSTSLASGGSFTNSEATDFCIAGTGADTAPPTNPTNLSVSNEQDTQVTLSWNASSDNVGVTAYEVFLDGSSIGTLTGTSANVTGLTACTGYNFGVRALDAAGNASGQATASGTTNGCTTADTTPPTDPTNLAVSNEQDAQISLSWNASSDNVGVTAYEIFLDGSSIGTVTGTSANVTGLTACTRYNFGVRALDAAGNASKQAAVSGTTTGCTTADTTPPTDPTNLSVSNEQDAQISLSWNASSDNVGVTAYEIFLDGSPIGSVTGTNADVTGLTPCTRYNFGVRALDAAGNASNQATSSGTTTGCSSGTGFTEAYFFETGLQGWADGGSDCARLNTSRSYEGNYSVRIRDNSGTASSMTSPTYDLAGLASVDINFYFYPNSMENGEDFWVRYNDGSSWQTVAVYTGGTSFQNGSYYTAAVTLNAGSFNFTDGAQFRFQCDASGNNDQIYIDQVTVTGNVPAGANATGDAIVTIEKIPTIRRFDIQEEDDYEVKIAPNPASDIINIIAGEEIQEVSIFSVDGKLLMRRVFEGSDRVTLKVSDLPTGMYLVSVLTDEERNTERMVIRR
jgi:subtilisin family serine protease/chitodextrinase